MKKIYLLRATLLVMLLGMLRLANAQEETYFSDNCSAIVTINADCTFYEEISINVSGAGIMGQNNYGIVEAFFDIRGDFFNAYLVAPNGQQYLLAGGSFIFPDQDINNFANFAFRDCKDLPYPVGYMGDPNGGTFQPQENFAALNNSQSISADGVWKMRFCGAPNLEVICGRLKFGPICPEMNNLNVTNPECSGQQGTIAFDIVSGSCNPLYTINDGFPQSGSNINMSVDPGSYTICVGEAEPFARQSGLECETCTTIVISVVDNDPPVFTNIPEDMTISVNAACAGAFAQVDPDYSDNCGFMENPYVELFDPAGEYVIQNSEIEPGASFNYDLDEGLGDYTFVWTAIDQSGNTTTEYTVITLVDDTPPVWTGNTNIVLEGECGIDDFQSLLTQAQAQLQGVDNCVVNHEINLVSSVEEVVCGDHIEYFEYWEITDGTNTNPTLAQIQISMIDTTPPVLNGVPADVTITCNENFPNMPNVTAIDACSGDISSQIILQESVDMGTCDLFGNTETITYTYQIADGCNNTAMAAWTITLYNDEAVDLGPDALACQGDIYTITTNGLEGSYQWSTGATTPSIDVSGDGNYSVTVTGLSGCCSIDEINVSFESVPVAFAEGGTLDCSGEDVQLMGSSSEPGSTYAWSGPGGFTSSIQNPSVSQAGTYTLTVTNASGTCSDQTTTEVFIDVDVPDVSTTGGTIDCNNATVTLQGSSTTPNVTYLWSGPNGFSSTNPNPTVSVGGDYTLFVTAPNSCVAEGLAVVVVDTNTPTLSLEDDIIDCNEPTVELIATTNDPNASYQWSGPNGFSSTETSPTVSIAGDYMLTITSDNGCTASALSVISQDTDTPNISADGETITCDNPIATLTASSSTSGVSYQWTGPNGYSSSQPVTTTDIGGTYQVQVTASNGCTSSMQVIVDEDNNEPTVTTLDEELDCNTTEVVLSLTVSPAGDYTYAWTGPNGYSSGDENPTITEPGTYEVVVTGSNGCTGTTSSMVAQDIATPDVSATGGTITCDNNTVTLSGSSTTSGVSYSWTGPNDFTSSQASPTVGSEGTYTLTVTAPNGCTAAESVEVTADSNLPDINASGGDLDCTTTAVQLMGSSMTPDVTYLWAGPNGFSSTDQNPTVDVPGNYTLSVSAPNGCVSTTSIEVINDNIEPNISAEGGVLSCDIGEVQLMGSSTTSDVSYAWTGPDGFTSSVANPTVTIVGTYSLTITGANGCTSTADVEVTADTDTPDASATGGQIDCGNDDIQLMGSSNTAGATYAWIGPDGYSSSEQNPNVSLPGTYTLTVTAPNGCSTNTTAEVSLDTDIPDASATGGTLTCTQTNVQLMGSSTTEGVSYSWTGPNDYSSDMANPMVSEAGTYQLVVTAPNGCNATQFATVTSDDDIPVLTTQDGDLNCSIESIALSLTVSVEDYTVAWTGPSDFSSTELNPIVTEPGTYNVTVTSANGCTAMDVVTITQDVDTPDISATGGMITCEQNTVTLMGSSNTEGVTYSWTGPNGFMSEQNNPVVGTGGTYSLTVAAANGCTSSLDVEVVADGNLPDISATGGTIDCNNSSIQLNGSSTTEGVTYAWSGPGDFSSEEQNPTISLPGIYEFTVTATNGCASSTQVNVANDTQVPAVIAIGGALTCTTTTIQIAGSSIAGVTYAWSGPNGFSSEEQNPIVELPGTYILTVTAPNGCVASATAEVIVDDTVPDAELDVSEVDCENGEVTLSIINDEIIQYQWNHNGNVIATGSSVNVSNAGVYSVIAMSANGCSIELTYDLVENIGSLLAEIGTTDATDGNNGTATLSANNILPINILWDNGQTGPNATDLAPGDHTVTVTDVFGCIYTFPFSISMGTAVDDIELLSKLSVYPTVARDRVHYEANFSASVSPTLYIINTQGQIIFQEELGQLTVINKSIDISNYPVGVYNIALLVDGQLHSEKVIKY